ncbi:plasmid stability protein stbC [Achromobacter sp. 77]|jgi:antitoxin FitA|uniref:plasmid stability protein stbC n=1 Tax=Achromobacter TaxID=222 RepID=UPI001D033F50|nr:MULTISPECIES: plasmid stability protein stbC [Achromobacter]MCU6617103.1 plasmid stability protein stbC [Achromobacter mucicolens]UDG77641.1 plasmid stability protein stbC [Achromobacter sp. 77]
MRSTLPEHNAKHGGSIEAEVCSSLEEAARLDGRLKVGSALASIARKAGSLSEKEIECINRVRDKEVAIPMDFR